MSLIITGNKLVESGVRDIGESQPAYHYRNFLKETITLPPDSEVAVQSVKITKGGGIRISADDGFYIMWNKDLAKLDDGSNEYSTTGTPIWCPIGLKDSDIAEDVSIDEYAIRLTEAIRKGVPHPDLNYIPSSALSNRYYPLVEPSYDSSSGRVDGFEIFFAQNEYDDPQNNITTINGTESKWFFDTDPTLVSAISGNNIKILANKGTNDDSGTDNHIVYTGKPITYKGGNLRFNVDGLLKDVSSNDFENMTDWAVGLTRSKSKTATHSPNDVKFTDEGLMPSVSGATKKDSPTNFQFFDYVIRCVTDANGTRELVLGHMVMKDGTTDGEMCMREIDYYSFAKSGSVDNPKLFTADSGGGANNRYNLTTNTKGVRQYLIRIENDIVQFYYNSYTGLDTGADPMDYTYWILFCSYDQNVWSGGDAAVNYKVNYPKPINQNTWWLYPAVFIEQDATKDYFLELDNYSGVERNGLSDTYYNPKYDWRVEMFDEGEESITKEIDSRYFNQMDNTKTYDFMTITSNSDPYLKEQSWVMILKEDDEYYPSTTLAQDDFIGNRMGFPNIKILRPDINGQATSVGKENNKGNQNDGWVYESTDVPSLLGSGSLFVRLDNYTQKTLNGAVGRPSKILYTIPSYDVNGNNGGQLFYEPADRVYVKLNNPQPLTINTFDISVCDENERLATQLLDQSIIALHFRDTPRIN